MSLNAVTVTVKVSRQSLSVVVNGQLVDLIVWIATINRDQVSIGIQSSSCVCISSYTSICGCVPVLC